MAPSNIDECGDAYTNPACPYVTQINSNTGCLKNIDKCLVALLGPDGTGLNDGVIYDILDKLDKLEHARRIQASWVTFLKPILLSVISTALATYFITRFLG